MPVGIGDYAVIAAPGRSLSCFQERPASGQCLGKGAINRACSAMVLRQAENRRRSRGVRLRLKSGVNEKGSPSKQSQRDIVELEERDFRRAGRRAAPAKAFIKTARPRNVRYAKSNER